MILLKTLIFAQVICYLVFGSPLYSNNKNRINPMQKIEAETKPKNSMGPLARKLFTGFGKYINYNRGQKQIILLYFARKCPVKRINSAWNLQIQFQFW